MIKSIELPSKGSNSSRPLTGYALSFLTCIEMSLSANNEQNSKTRQ